MKQIDQQRDFRVSQGRWGNTLGEIRMARPARRRIRREWTAQDIRELRKHSKSKTPVVVISKATKRTPAALRQKARLLGLPLGHRR